MLIRHVVDSTVGQGGTRFLRGTLAMFSALMLYSHIPLPRGYGLDKSDEWGGRFQQQGAEMDWPIP